VLAHYQRSGDWAETPTSAFCGNYSSAVLNWRIGSHLAILDVVTLIYNSPPWRCPSLFGE
jgi:hypothetical protein